MAVKKSEVVATLNKLPGFLKTGPYYIGTCSGEILSGYAIDAPPGSLYLWKFVLPAYDRFDFLHLSLGRRIFSSSIEKLESAASVPQLLIEDWKTFSTVRDSLTLREYISREDFAGEYRKWVEFLTFVWTADFEQASSLEQSWEGSGWIPTIPSIAANFNAAMSVKTQGGWQGVKALLETWSVETRRKYCVDMQ